MNKFIRNFIALALTSIVVFGVNTSYALFSIKQKVCYAAISSNCKGNECPLFLHDNKDMQGGTKDQKIKALQALVTNPDWQKTSNKTVDLGDKTYGTLEKDNKVTVHGEAAVIEKIEPVTIKNETTNQEEEFKILEIVAAPKKAK